MPQPFKNAVVTDAGMQLLAKAQAGEIKIEFTRIETGNGIYGEQEKDPEQLKAMAGLKSTKNSVPLSGVSVYSENSVKVSALITNFDPVTQETVIADGYYINEMGLFAKEKDGEGSTEVLYSIAVTAGETGDYMPPYNGCSPVQIIQDYYVTVSNSAEVTVQGGAGAPALADDLRAVERKMEQKLENYRVIRILARKDAVTSYIGFASLPLPSAAGRSEVTLLVSGTGNMGSPLCGTYLVQCGTKDHVSMAVTELTPPGSDGDIAFGYWQKSDRVIFGMKRGSYNYNTNIAMASEDVDRGIDVYEVAELYSSNARPSGWTESKKRKLLASDENAASATKAMQDGDGRVIADTYAKKKIYGDDAISLGRREGSTVGKNSMACGGSVEASGSYSHAEGSSTNASGSYSHAEGGNTTASEMYSHAEGQRTTASGSSSHAEGYNGTASGKNSHAEGEQTTASGENSHAEGLYTRSGNYSSHASGKFSKAMTAGGAAATQVGDVFIVGNGTGASALSNALRITYTGSVYGKSAFQSSGADYAEFIKPWADGNADNEDRVGYFVTVKNGLLYKADAGDYIAGVTSGNPSIVGNADEDYYWMHERDDFNRIVMEDVPETVQKTDGEGKPVFDETTHEPVMEETGRTIKNARMKLAGHYDPSLQEGYTERKDRKEWDYVGMLGVLPVRDDGTCIPGQFCRCGTGGIATLAEERGFDAYMVIERVSDGIVSVILR